MLWNKNKKIKIGNIMFKNGVIPRKGGFDGKGFILVIFIKKVLSLLAVDIMFLW